NIDWAEAVAVELGLRMAANLGLLCPRADNWSTFLVHSDNAGIVTVTNKGRSCSHETNQILKHIFALQARHRIRIITSHVSTRDNISDALSCGDL
ncbi:hypothetical protein K439DRAFT_1235906, partial [Ramaria rubella]